LETGEASGVGFGVGKGFTCVFPAFLGGCATSSSSSDELLDVEDEEDSAFILGDGLVLAVLPPLGFRVGGMGRFEL
jgi:hypothetical protein